MYDGCTRNAYHLYMFRYDPKAFDNLPREKFLAALAAEGIPNAQGYGPLNKEVYLKDAIHLRAYQKVYSKAELDRWVDRNQCPVNDRLCQEAVWLWQNQLLGPVVIWTKSSRRCVRFRQMRLCWPRLEKTTRSLRRQAKP